MEINQRAVRRLALAAHGKITSEAVQGYMGWTSVEVREAQSKIGYEVRLRNINDHKWPSRVCELLYLKSVDTQWRKRTRKLTATYMKPQMGEVVGTIKKKVKEAETNNREKKWNHRSG